ncbi:acyl-CoA carboxylase subunit epsilon [Lacisediminihabitans profunda]|uniref:Acyl-CoA carboxylase subunit epsilon n=1 Tax=Lacisediminihabitans profunda TaxID=2594790 RepID=A0A5C8ULN1_9MICO|nr:acyl-CoA carboxylase subunit epsilon [Lacisediminihabitans profunda]TXN28262.1 acyl-CoA carboxylase subunit epsilon [Lacisediminihabitans profunda]
MSGSEAQEAAEAITVLGGDPTPLELAAVTAVITAMLDEAQDDDDSRLARGGQSAWQRSQRQLRGTLVPGYGAWRSFSG